MPSRPECFASKRPGKSHRAGHIDDKGHIQPALPGRDTGEVRHPELMGAIGRAARNDHAHTAELPPNLVDTIDQHARLPDAFNFRRQNTIPLGLVASLGWVTSTPHSPRCSCTLRTARSRNSGVNFLDFFIAPSFQRLAPPRFPGRFNAPGEGRRHFPSWVSEWYPE
jgi:hypothetical protein